MSIFPLNSFDFAKLKVNCAIEQIGKGLTVVVSVIVEQELGGIGKRFCLGNDLISSVESTTIHWNLMAEEN